MGILDVNGLDCEVGWVHGLGDKSPAISRRGVNAKVHQIAADELDEL